jgi:hypothetical protein
MKIRALAAFGVLALGSSLANAAVVTGLGTVQDLINAGATGITVGDKQFNNFSYQGTGVAADQINVVPAPGSDVGVEFQFNWSSSNGNNEDSVIRFDVHVLDPAKMITGIGLHFNGNASNNNGLLTNASVTEAVDDLGGNPIGSLSVFNAGPNFSSVNHNDAFLAIAPTRDLMVTKDILLHSAASITADVAPAATDPTATISLVDNTFRQTGGPTSVPLPSAAWAALSMVGLGAFAPLRRKVRAVLAA